MKGEISGEITTDIISILYKIILDYFCTLFVPPKHNTLINTHGYFLYRANSGTLFEIKDNCH
jgi:hypothetical protein